MTLSDGLLPRASQSRASQPAACRCPQCGGSGILRLADQRYRTCLDCLGQGQVVPADGCSTAAEVLKRHAALAISVSASSAAR